MNGTGRETSQGTPDLREKAEASPPIRGPGVSRVSLDEMSALVHELQVHQVESEMQNETLRQTQISLEEAIKKYRDFYDFAPVGFLTLDESGLIREVNLTLARPIRGHPGPPDR